MMRQEFEQKVNEDISNAIWDSIHTVYNFHPAIDEVKGKDQIAYLYRTFGMTVIEDMLPRAQKIKELELKKQELDREKQAVDAEIMLHSTPETL